MTNPSFTRNPPVFASDTPLDADFLRRMLHDLRSPVRHIRGFNRLIAEETKRFPEDTTPSAQLRALREINEYTEVIERAANTMNAYCDSLREFFLLLKKDDSTSMIHLNDLLDKVWGEVQLQHAGVDAKLVVGEGVEDQEVDQSWHAMLTQVIDNCFRYRAPERPLRVVVRAVEDAQTQNIEVDDNGIGFDMKYADRAFEPFERLVSTQPTRPGLGLTVLKTAASLQGISVSLNSEINVGTIVRMSCPARQTNSFPQATHDSGQRSTAT